MRISDWSSDVCSSDLDPEQAVVAVGDLRPLEDDGPRDLREGQRQHREVDAGETHAEPTDHERQQPRAEGRKKQGQFEDRKSVVEGKSVSVRVDLGGSRIIKKQK